MDLLCQKPRETTLKTVTRNSFFGWEFHNKMSTSYLTPLPPSNSCLDLGFKDAREYQLQRSNIIPSFIVSFSAEFPISQ